VRTLIDFDGALVFAIPVIADLGYPAIHQGMLLEGPQGWGEFSPPEDCTDAALVRWLTAAVEAGTVGWPDPVRGRIPIAVTVPATNPERAQQITVAAGCRSAQVRVADRPDSLAEDIARVAAVRDALGTGGAIRCDAGGSWDVDTAVSSIAALDTAAGGLEYVKQPCQTLADLATVRRKVEVRIAAQLGSETSRDLTEAADVAVLSCGPLGGARRALRVAEKFGGPCAVESELQSSIGLAAGLALAGALPELPFACELGMRSALAADLVAEARSLTPVDGYLPVAPMPAAPDRDLLGRYTLADPDRLSWWQSRLRRAATAS